MAKTSNKISSTYDHLTDAFKLRVDGSVTALAMEKLQAWYAAGMGSQTGAFNGAQNQNSLGGIQQQNVFSNAAQGQIANAATPHNAHDSLRAQVYKRYILPGTKPVAIRLDWTPEEANIAPFLVGKQNPAVMYVDVDSYLDIEDLPPEWREPAMMLQAAISKEDKVTRLPGIGTVRQLGDGVLYFRIYI